MVDYSARYLDNAYGRFTSVDPMAETKPWLTPYHYCSNNPLNRIDPDGLTDFINNKTGETYNDNDIKEQILIINPDDYKSIIGLSEQETWNKDDANLFSSILERGEEIDLNSDLGLLARIGYAEFRGSNSTEQQNGMDITLNRVEDSQFPNTLKGVIEQKKQYSSLNIGDPNKKYYDNPESTLSNEKGKTIKHNRDAWIKSISNSILVSKGDKRGISQGAVLYYSPRSMKPKGSTPGWNFKILEEVRVEGVRETHLKMFKRK